MPASPQPPPPSSLPPLQTSPSIQQGAFVPDNEPAKNVWHWLDFKALAAAGSTQPVLVDACEEATPPGGYPLGGQTRITLRNEHMQYILTWYSLSAATLVMWFYVGRRGGGARSLSKRRLPPPIPKPAGQ